MAAKRDIEIKRGDDYAHTFTFMNEDRCTPLDLSDRSYRSQIRKRPAQELPDAEFTWEITEPLNGKMVIRLSNTVTESLTPGTYFWDLEEIVYGLTSTLVEGRCVVTADVTR